MSWSVLVTQKWYQSCLRLSSLLLCVDRPFLCDFTKEAPLFWRRLWKSCFESCLFVCGKWKPLNSYCVRLIVVLLTIHFILFFPPDDNLRFRQGDVYSLLSPLLKDCVRVLNASSLVIVKSAKLLRLLLKLIIVLLHACFCASRTHPSGTSFVLPSGGFVLSQ